jgi:hypothetical protein
MTVLLVDRLTERGGTTSRREGPASSSKWSLQLRTTSSWSTVSRSPGCRAVRQLKAAGAQHWWFEADHQAAREAFIARNKEWARSREHEPIDIGAFETYVSEIAAHRDEIRTIFHPKIIETLQPGGERLPNKDIDRQVVAGSAWPTTAPRAVKIGRNDPCWCGSGKNYKRCHGQ